MRSILKGILIFIGVLLLAFAINLTAYMAVPSYKDALKDIVNSNMDDADKSAEVKDMRQPVQEKEEYQEGKVKESRYEADNSRTDAVKSTAEQEKKPLIIDKEYHEDCGTGKGYWIIKYEDGTIGIE